MGNKGRKKKKNAANGASNVSSSAKKNRTSKAKGAAKRDKAAKKSATTTKNVFGNKNTGNSNKSGFAANKNNASGNVAFGKGSASGSKGNANGYKGSANGKGASKRKKGRMHGGAIAAISILIFVGAFTMIYLIIAQNYKTKFLPGTMINQTDVGDLTLAQARQKITESRGNYQIQVKFRDDAVETIVGTDIDYEFHPDEGVKAILETQNPYMWIRSYFTDAATVSAANTAAEAVASTSGVDLSDAQLNDEGNVVGGSATFSEEKLLAALEALPEMQTTNMIKPEDAYVTWQDSDFVVVPEVEGTTLNTEVVFEDLKAAITVCADEVDVTTNEETYEEPSLRSTDEGLQQKAANLNELLPGSVTYTMYTGTDEVLDGSVLIDWLERDANGEYYKDETSWATHITDFVEEMVEKYDTIGLDHEFNATELGLVTVEGSNYYGWEISRAEEIAQLTEDLASGEDVTRTPMYYREEAADYEDNYCVGSTYVEVDLSRQHLWIYVDGTLELETDVVSGQMNQRHHTPEGIFKLLNKQRSVVLRGPRADDGTFAWESPVSYWMPITKDGVGLHDASWRGSFGGNIYIWSGSHGCINLPPSIAGEVYDLVDYDMPIVVYYSEEYTLH